METKFNVAVGKSRTQKVWKNTEYSWPQIIEKLKDTHRTHESVIDYMRMPKAKQDTIKDVGGFVGGYLEQGLRTKVKYRQIIALDIDFGGMELWDEWLLNYGNTACVYSTHKHTPSSPRLRLIIPLSKKVELDEYQAISRRIAYDLGIEAFDDTTYQPQRLMYWPSTSKDGEYVFDSIEDSFLDPKVVLDAYEDWRDVTSWPTSSRATSVVRKDINRQKDPLDKVGIVGAFCRAYTIHEAIEKFVPEYAPCDISGRYTYIEGSTAAGVITYDDKFSFSHHGTDPASSVLCNAFDLVRMHKFKDLDDEAKEGTTAVNMPSYKAMEDLAVKDNKVKKEVIKSKQEIVNQFDVEGEDWFSKLEVTKKGQIVSSYKNIKLILSNDPKLKGKFGFNELRKCECLLSDVPWRKYDKFNNVIEDSDDANIRIYLENNYGIQGKDKIYDSVNSICHEHAFHPIKEYIEEIEWDGIERLDTLFIDYFAVEDSEYVRAVSSKALIAAVKRIYEPGSKFDNMLTLKGPQGCGKSSFFNKLAKGWFTDSIKDLRNKDSLESLQGVWIVEFGELTAMRKTDSETIKNFLSGTVDRFRMSYARRTKDYPRQCIFVGTTNESEFLRDKTGNRRFWVISASKVRKPKKDVFKITSEEINQIWAEAKVRYDVGEDIHLSNELEKQAIIEQESYTVEDPQEAIILDYLDRLLPTDWDNKDIYERQQWLESDAEGSVERTRVCTAEVWCEALGHADTDKLDQYRITEINKIVDKLKNWEKQKSPIRFKNYGPKRGYVKV